MLRPFRPYHDHGGLANAHHVLELQDKVLRGAVVGIDLARQPPHAPPFPGGSWRIDREVANRHVAPPQDAARTAQRQQVAGQQDGDCTAAGAHVEAGAASSGSESEPPGTIIGNTLASCSITSSTSVGPGVSFAWRNASVTSLAFFTRQPGMPYASASLT